MFNLIIIVLWRLACIIVMQLISFIKLTTCPYGLSCIYFMLMFSAIAYVMFPLLNVHFLFLHVSLLCSPLQGDILLTSCSRVTETKNEVYVVFDIDTVNHCFSLFYIIQVLYHLVPFVDPND
jgi:hypothetical protein